MRGKAVLTALIFMLLLLPGRAYATDFSWEIKWKKDFTIYERITLGGKELDGAQTSTWKHREVNGDTILEREIVGWEDYERAEGLPLTTSSKNYIIFKITTFSYDNNYLIKNSIYDKLAVDDSGRVAIEVPGFIKRSTADHTISTGNSITAVWNISKGDSDFKTFSLQVITLEALPIILIIFLLGVTIITVMYIKQLRRINKLIDEEYSLDNLEDEDFEEYLPDFEDENFIVKNDDNYE